MERHAISAAHRIDQLRQQFRKRGWPIVYVNDNFGEWHSEEPKLVARALEKYNPVTELLAPF
ncbi:isochorismatase-like protein [Novosphingobium sp. Rr 2-17]|nr:isochorismatase-like protein [Novosphingobium sp. Rr 2-17]